MSALDPVPMDSIVFYKPPLAVAPAVDPVHSLPTIPKNNGRPALLQNSKLYESWKCSQIGDHENSVAIQNHYDGSSDDADFSSLSECLSFAKQKGVSIAAKLSPGSTAEKTVDHTPDGYPASSSESRAGGSQDEPIVLNDDDEQSESTQSEAGNGDHDVDSTGVFDSIPPRDPTSGLVGDGFDSRTLLSNYTAADDSDADDCNGNNYVTIDERSLHTKRQKSASSYSDFIFDCERPNKSEDDYVFDVFATDDDDDDEDSRSTKRRKLSAVSCRNPSPRITISKLQDGRSDQTQSSPIAVVAVPQSGAKSGHDGHGEGVAESDGDNRLRSHIIELTDTASSVTISHQSTNVGDPQPGDLWEIRKLIGMKTVDGVEHFWVDWEPTWICESELEGARELMDEFKARLSALRGDKNKQGEIDATGEAQSRRRRGRPRK